MPWRCTSASCEKSDHPSAGRAAPSAAPCATAKLSCSEARPAWCRLTSVPKACASTSAIATW